ncbi:MAG: hypothetical protein GY874_01910 [Desulfobacteraceae bacterium]|nr:hypothetical protein [Desulfobacteraceae bacterium]
MTKEISQDFKRLSIFIEQFDLENIANKPEFLNILKPMHKKLFAMMTFIVEVEQKNSELNILSEYSLNYLKESVSDIGQSLFCWIQGAYKPANLILRSSIETFVRAVAGQEKHEIFSEKNAYKIFEIAQTTTCLNSAISKEFFDIIHHRYKDLCKIVHTGNFAVMAHISALRTFPLFANEEAKKVGKDFIDISTGMISLVYINYYKFIHKMHYKNNNNFLCAIPRSTKKKINTEKG